ncbi:MAG: hypothetical protein SFW08_10970 [Gemmatimonadaceae bacterium]|nr:hypothetical protein [Gemmatimonadaceae bacterium]
MLAQNLNPEPSQVFHIAAPRVASRDADAPPVEKFGQRAHPRAGNTDEMDVAGVFSVEKSSCHEMTILILGLLIILYSN